LPNSASTTSIVDPIRYDTLASQKTYVRFYYRSTCGRRPSRSRMFPPRLPLWCRRWRRRSPRRRSCPEWWPISNIKGTTQLMELSAKFNVTKIDRVHPEESVLNRHESIGDGERETPSGGPVQHIIEKWSQTLYQK
jgi:hypothetical protein